MANDQFYNRRHADPKPPKEKYKGLGMAVCDYGQVSEREGIWFSSVHLVGDKETIDRLSKNIGKLIEAEVPADAQATSKLMVGTEATASPFNDLAESVKDHVATVIQPEKEWEPPYTAFTKPGQA